MPSTFKSSLPTLSIITGMAAYSGLRRVHTMKVMHIGSELIRIVCIHTECTFGQSTSIGGLKANCIITGINACYIFTRDRLYKEMSNKERNNKRNAIASLR